MNETRTPNARTDIRRGKGLRITFGLFSDFLLGFDF